VAATIVNNLELTSMKKTIAVKSHLPLHPYLHLHLEALFHLMDGVHGDHGISAAEDAGEGKNRGIEPAQDHLVDTQIKLKKETATPTTAMERNGKIHFFKGTLFWDTLYKFNMISCYTAN
jgi:hypothetical protein